MVSKTRAVASGSESMCSIADAVHAVADHPRREGVNPGVDFAVRQHGIEHGDHMGSAIGQDQAGDVADGRIGHGDGDDGVG